MVRLKSREGYYIDISDVFEEYDEDDDEGNQDNETEDAEALEDENEVITEAVSEFVPLEKAEIGSIVLFGSYPQTEAENDQTPIEWQGLDKQGDKLLLISDEGLVWVDLKSSKE